ncbi:MAG TPA: NAD(P)-dependent alcohol dehydrogenase [Anaerolineales bacterium]|nr:NAD(P)-dependent alcohol dehydrogenase [Anaerolineales bacterium]
MKAIIWTNYGPPEVLKLQEIEKPTPEDNQILVKVHATTVTAGDCEMRSLKFPPYLAIPMRLYVGVVRPTRVKIIGQEFSGEVVEVGAEVTKYKVGDRIFGNVGFGFGTYAEYVCLAETPGEMGGMYGSMPADLSYQEAAAVPTGGLEALHFLREANLQPGQRLLINGAGGSIGTFGVQLARLAGAHITAVDSGPKLAMLRELGADEVIDYTKEDFTQRGQQYDAIFDVIGKAPLKGAMHSLTETGVYLLANPNLRKLMWGRWVSGRSGKRFFAQTNSLRREDLLQLKEWIEAGELKVVVDRSYSLAEAAEAHRYVETGQKQGNVIIKI